jgi:hypothetical protein
MSDNSGATIMGRWLVQEEAWAKTRAYKARKKNNNSNQNNQSNLNHPNQNNQNIQNQQQQPEAGSHTRALQQLNLKGDNIDEQDGEDFADTMTTKGPDTV